LVSIHRPRRLLGHGKVCRSILTGVLELDCALEFDAARTEEDFFPALPAAPAVCLLEPRDRRAEPFLIRTQNLQRRLQRLLGPADPASKRLNLRDFASGIRYRLTGSRFEQTLTFYQQARQRFPERYRNLMRLRPPTVLKVNLPNAYPRCYVTRKILLDADGRPAGGSYYGPFPSRRAAEAFAERILDFFKVRRCQIKIRRDPTFPGCIYSEMKMCLAPCFSGCTKQEYDVEVNRLVEFLETSGGSLRTAFEQERERASEQLDFERARAMHKRVEKLDEVLRGRPEITRPIQDLRAVILQRTAEEQTIGVFAVAGGRLAEPSFVRFGEIASQPRSAEQIFRDCLESAPHAANGDLSEDLSLVSRWFYSKPREGEIFFREKDWPYRRILRACSRLLARAEGEPAKSPAPRPRPSPEGAS
jgi:excinuclease ABC subunit C